MADIFVSYSSNDRAEALALVSRLRSSGYDVWTDQGGIDGAMNWSSEIVKAINDCNTVIFILSPSSAQSHNCAKEIHLASEKGKSILPIILEETPIPLIFEYPLAGLQRVLIDDFLAITKSLDSLATGKSPLAAMTELSSVIKDDIGPRIAVLPFSDLSPTKDNDWLADGMMDDLINTLGSLENVHVTPRSDVLYYKKHKPNIPELASELRVQYIVEGSVQKAGERIRIRVSLTDVTLHKTVWSKKYDSTFDDIFELQDRTCLAITDALRLTLTPNDKKLIEQKLTDSPEAYELYLKSQEHFERATRVSIEDAMELLKKAIAIDPSFVDAHMNLANSALSLYRKYERKPELIELARKHIDIVSSLEGDSVKANWIRSVLLLRTSDPEGALRHALHAAQRDPRYAAAHAAIAFAYQMLGNLDLAVNSWDRYLELRENDRISHMNRLNFLHELGDQTRLNEAAVKAKTVFRRHLKQNPEDLSARCAYTTILAWSGDRDGALVELPQLEAAESLDNFTIYNVACIYFYLQLNDQGMTMLSKAIDRGFRNIDLLKGDPDLRAVRDTPSFAELMNRVEA